MAIKWLFGAIVASLAHATLAQGDLSFEVEEIASGNFVHYGTVAERTPENLGDNANIGFIVGERCVAVVDTGGSLAVGQMLREAIRSRTPLPVCYVILTHAHPDHFFGAAAFRADQPVYLGHVRLPQALQQRSTFYATTLKRDLGDIAQGSEIVLPTLLVEDRMEVDLGGRKLLVTAWPNGHTDNDLTVLDQASGTFWASDLLFTEHTPVIDGSIHGFIAAIDDLKQLPVVRFVPGHGRTRQTWTQALESEQSYLMRILTDTRQALKDRKTLEEALDTVGADQAVNWVNFEQFHRRNVTAAYTELEWE